MPTCHKERFPLIQFHHEDAERRNKFQQGQAAPIDGFCGNQVIFLPSIFMLSPQVDCESPFQVQFAPICLFFNGIKILNFVGQQESRKIIKNLNLLPSSQKKLSSFRIYCLPYGSSRKQFSQPETVAFAQLIIQFKQYRHIDNQVKSKHPHRPLSTIKLINQPQKFKLPKFPTRAPHALRFSLVGLH